MSINARYMQLIVGEENFPFPEEATTRRHPSAGPGCVRPAWRQLEGSAEEERLDKLAQYGLSVNIPRMEEDLKRYGIVYDQWFFESALHNSGYVAQTVEMLKEKAGPTRRTAPVAGHHPPAEGEVHAGGQDPGAGGQAGPEGRRTLPCQRLLYLLCRRYRLPPQQAGGARL